MACAAGALLRRPDSLPDPGRPAGEPTAALPFDHLVVVMMENHSFDNYFGMLPRRGQPAADGFTFDAAGMPLNSNPVPGGYVYVSHATSECQPRDVPGNWSEVHEQIDAGRMDGFARTGVSAVSSMLYWDESDLPCYYSLARTFTLANRWFCSVPAPTFPNRRFLLAGTAYGETETNAQDVMDPPPPNGTIFDRLAAHGVDWRDYTTDLPSVGVIGSVVEKYPQNVVPVSQFYADCRSGALPAISFVDPEFGALDEFKAIVSVMQQQGLTDIAEETATQGGDEENPQDIQYGESFVASVVDAVLQSPLWPRTLLIYTYDEHGGYYDHVAPPPAIKPDSIPPKLGPTEFQAGYDLYGPRVPAIVVSPYSRPHAVTNVVHDHTSVLATIEAKWNLPACTYRDANAATVADFLDTTRPALLEPPALAPVGDLSAGIAGCSDADPTLPVHSGRPPVSTQPPGRRASPAPRVLVRFYGRRHALGGALATISSAGAPLNAVTVSLRRSGRLIAETRVAHVGTQRRRVILEPLPGRRLGAGRYELTVSRAGHSLARRAVRLG